MTSSPPPTNPPPGNPPAGHSAEPPPPAGWWDTRRPCWGLDRLGLTQAIGGLVLGLIALFSSYDHITLAGTSVRLQQQWGIACIAASLALVVVEFVQYSAPHGRDAQLATRARDRAAHEGARERDLAREEREQAAGRAQLQARRRSLLRMSCLVAQSRFLLADTARSRLQLSEAVALLMEQLRSG